MLCEHHRSLRHRNRLLLRLLLPDRARGVGLCIWRVFWGLDELDVQNGCEDLPFQESEMVFFLSSVSWNLTAREFSTPVALFSIKRLAFDSRNMRTTLHMRGIAGYSLCVLLISSSILQFISSKFIKPLQDYSLLDLLRNVHHPCGIC